MTKRLKRERVVGSFVIYFTQRMLQATAQRRNVASLRRRERIYLT